ncbi:MAG: (E)-4-hydroxy-3-methylbut-2-enyl-diphosphate synthase [Candidatus Marinimicrobia bacterium]|jgi:(E)-4-hydroxy-3-methylbut-2-enyl-diphosphate synthase|nr:(E)-4-hydroxy-3-methylbut-2-enyl-diphosphate synthase [Candidatus Neomarinimicrobiota bacterium]MBT3501278.1 (E)-4-hydroxy-3-methylbut-2-enyl-diphosphate synthase [Candidatus Neomarinimicrobiota bacterium]MBT3839182.1 (E)-4-hydroxy-3-methylbut-2-enyl-diphosphate synthase [Candidatus Neomarinimicrobiota bacterium]MBT3999055.1 (E)-4-hydroxy-3-methylbut-2-enyl-diphosphate synthase [Candidatus Neomarinimicrobiota bacterium]MBT4283111.1 (E)-4-hydroxy-3-methylbut-2-enyl-diphosphate synthase [Candi
MQIYCPSLTHYERWNTREVMIGNLGIGGNNPIRIQSMTTTNTMDTEGSIAQSIRMINAGCELVRITAPSVKEAENLQHIKDGLATQGYKTPLVADIHFTPNAAEVAARIVEKVRINPGNYADRKKFETHDYSDESYLEEINRIQDRFIPLVKICKEYGTAMRIGTNHGSLSDRIMSRYGDTPLGMVESAMEFLRIAEAENYQQIILSMKASNTQVMVQAYRLLVKTMVEEGMNYPLHLGVTEAGEGEDGRIKSAVGIGTLLEDGLGDTIRVSLTEDPEAEIPVAKILVNRYFNRIANQESIPKINDLPYDPFYRLKRETNKILNLGGSEVPRVIGDLSDKLSISYQDLIPFGYLYSETSDKWYISDQAVDFLYTGNHSIEFEIPVTLGIIQNFKSYNGNERSYSLHSIKTVDKILPNQISFLIIDSGVDLDKLTNLTNTIFILETNHNHGYADQRRFFMHCIEKKIRNPIIIKRAYHGELKDEFLLYSSTDVGGLQIDGFGDGVWIESDIESGFINEISFGILQASRSRISKTEYISCPSCGRTLFDLQETTAKIRARTDHLKGIKIGVMGCIVNGPGEMADADYGYVGTGVGQISLYKGQDVVEKNIPEDSAVDQLIKLIESYGDWVEPSNV